MIICPTCSQPCEFKNGIECTKWICAKKDGIGNSDPVLDNLFSIFGMKPGDPEYNKIKNSNRNQ